MVVAELARLRAGDSGSSGGSSSAAAAAKQRQQAARRGQPQQAPPLPPQPQQLEQAGHGQLPPRFTDAELVRFAIMQGLLQAASPAEREAKLQEGAAAAARTALWLERHPFSSDDELSRFAHLVRWEVRVCCAVLAILCLLRCACCAVLLCGACLLQRLHRRHPVAPARSSGVLHCRLGSGGPQCEVSPSAPVPCSQGPDAAGRPVLRIFIGEAVTECRGNAALAFANAILTHMEQVSAGQL